MESLTPRQKAQQAFTKDYTMGISQRPALVDQVVENKHGIDNPVVDLNTSPNIVGSDFIFGNVTFDASGVLSPIVIGVQNQSGIMTLQTGALTSTRFPFADVNGELVDSANFTTATVYRAGGTDVALADGGTGASLADPGANKLWGWDDTDNAINFWTLGAGLTYTHATHTLSSAAGSPGGTDTQIQYNNSSAFGGMKIDYTEPSASFVQLTVEDQTVSNTDGRFLYIQGALGNGTGTGGGIDLLAGWDQGNVGYGSELLLRGSPTTGKPNDSYLGAAYPVDGDGGDVLLFGTPPDGTGTNPGVVKIADPVTNINARLDASLLSSTDKTFSFLNQTGTLIVKTDTVSLTGQVADITDTAFSANTAGIYRVNYYLLDTTADLTAGAVTLNIKFTDNAAARTISSSAVLLTATTSFAQGEIIVRLNSGNTTYGVTHTGIYGTAMYALYIALERLN